jgi:hypothetical protein
MLSLALHWLSFVVSVTLFRGWLVSDHGAAIHRGNLVMARAFSFHVVVVTG